MLWKPAFFGVKPSLVMHRRHDRHGADGRSQRLDLDAAAGALPADVRRSRRRARASTGVTFVSKAALDDSIGKRLHLKKSLVAVKRNTRTIRKKDMIHNSLAPKIEVDPQNYQVRVDGKVITCEPARGPADGAALLPVLTGTQDTSIGPENQLGSDPEKE